MEQAVAERPFSQEQHAGQLRSWRNETDDRRGTNLQNSSQSRDPRRWTVGDRNHMSNSNIDGKDIRENRDPSSVCRDNLRGKCSRGSSCKFQHVDSDGVGSYRSGQWNLGPTSEPGNSQQFGGSKDGDSYTRPPCRKFQWGTCYRGSTCPYLHPQSIAISSTGVDNSSRRPFFRESRERSPCRNFLNGRCNRGSSCPYLHCEFSESDRPLHKLNAGQQHRIVTASRNFGFHEGNVNNTFNTSQVHGVANKENNSRSSFSREPQRRSPCRNYLNGRCHFGSSCSRWHPDNAHGHNWSAENSNNHDLAGGHQYNNLKTVPRSRSPCHFIHRGNGYQATPSANLHPATVYERTRYDLGARNEVTATSRDLNFNRGNVVREVNNQGVQPYVNTHPGYNREIINGSWRGLSSERKRSRPVSDFGEDQVQPQVCLRFTKGRCDQGGNCRYLHSFHEYASSITQPNQKPHLETTVDVMSIDQANQCAEGNENVNSWSRPFKRPRTWSRSSFSPEGNRFRMLRRDYSLGDYHRSRSHHESQNQHPDYRSFKHYGPENDANNEQHLKNAATSVIPHENTDFVVMAAAGQGELMSHRMHRDQCQSGCPRLEGAATINQEPVESERCETAGIKVDLNHETNENSEETKHIIKTYSRKLGHNQHPNSYECGVEYTMGDVTHTSSRSLSINSSMGGTSLDYKSVVPGSVVSEDINTSVPKTGDTGDVLVSETMTMKVQSTMVGLSSADTRDGSLLGVTDNSTLPASQPSDAAILSSRRKLLVLDVNGLLADIVGDFPDRFKPDTTVGGKGVFKRPFCDNFLDFCFEKFDVGIWSSRTEKNVTRVLDCLMKNTKDKLLFCWHQSHCTQTGYKTVENNDKPLVLKELKKLWEKQEKDLPWKKGFYNETNTILLDDSPYKALRNPPYTAIFPFPYSFRHVGDKSLGPDGDLRLYLERLAEAENVQKFIQENPYGQRAITKTNLSWAFYSKIAGDYASPQEPIARTSSNSAEVNDMSQILLSLNAPAQPLR